MKKHPFLILIVLTTIMACSQPGGQSGASSELLDGDGATNVAPVAGPMIETATIPIEMSGAGGDDTVPSPVPTPTPDNGAGTDDDPKPKFFHIKGTWKEQASLSMRIDDALAWVGELFIASAYAETSQSTPFHDGIKDILVGPIFDNPQTGKEETTVGILGNKKLFLFDPNTPSEEWLALAIDIPMGSTTTTRNVGAYSYLRFSKALQKIFIIDKQDRASDDITLMVIADIVEKTSAHLAEYPNDLYAAANAAVAAGEIKAERKHVWQIGSAYDDLFDVALHIQNGHPMLALAVGGGTGVGQYACDSAIIRLLDLDAMEETNIQIGDDESDCTNLYPTSVDFLADGTLVYAYAMRTNANLELLKVVTRPREDIDAEGVPNYVYGYGASTSQVVYSYQGLHDNVEKAGADTDSASEIVYGSSYARVDAAAEGGFITLYLDQGFPGMASFAVDCNPSTQGPISAKYPNVPIVPDPVNINQCMKIIMKERVTSGLTLVRFKMSSGQWTTNTIASGAIESPQWIFANSGQLFHVLTVYDATIDGLVLSYVPTNDQCQEAAPADGAGVVIARYREANDYVPEIVETDGIRLMAQGAWSDRPTRYRFSARGDRMAVGGAMMEYDSVVEVTEDGVTCDYGDSEIGTDTRIMVFQGGEVEPVYGSDSEDALPPGGDGSEDPEPTPATPSEPPPSA